MPVIAKMLFQFLYIRTELISPNRKSSFSALFWMRWLLERLVLIISASFIHSNINFFFKFHLYWTCLCTFVMLGFRLYPNEMKRCDVCVLSWHNSRRHHHHRRVRLKTQLNFMQAQRIKLFSTILNKTHTNWHTRTATKASLLRFFANFIFFCSISTTYYPHRH